MSCYLIATFFVAWAAVNVAFRLDFIQDYATMQRAGAIALVSYWTPITLYFISALGLIIGRFNKKPYFASFFASVPPLYQLWASVLLPISTHKDPNYLALVTYVFLLCLFPLIIHRNIEAANNGRNS